MGKNLVFFPSLPMLFSIHFNFFLIFLFPLSSVYFLIFTKRCPYYISWVVKVSSCSYIKIFLKVCSNLSLFRNWVHSEFMFLSFVRIWVFEFVTNSVSEYGLNFEFWDLSQFDFLVTIWVFEFRHNLSFWIFSQSKFLSRHNKISEFCHNLIF